MKKRIISLILLITFFIACNNVKAATGSLGISANVNNAKIGQTVTVSIYAKGITGSFNVTSSNNSVLSGGCSNKWYENDTYTCEFTAKAAGNATVTVTSISANHNDDYSDFSGSKSVSINVIEEETKTYNYNNSNSNTNKNNNSNKNNNTNNNSSNSKNYSSDNTLSSLSVDGYKLDKDFDKETLEYTVEVESNIDKVNIIAKANDDKATISGNGEQNVSEGNNKLEVKVTAEDGSTKTYIINVVVKELEPIKIKIDNEEYTVIRKEGELEVPEGFEKTTIKINDQDVLAYKNDKLNYTLVLLKDKNSKVDYYIYDKGKYNKFVVLEARGIKVVVVDFPKNKKLKDYKEYEFTANDLKYKGLAKNKNSKFYLIYAKNYETGKESIYQYDSEENTLQRFNSDNIKLDSNEKSNNYKIPFIISIVIGLIILIAYIITIIKIKKPNKLNLKHNKNKL